MRSFWYVRSQKGVVWHRVYNKTKNVIDGDMASCGRRVGLNWISRKPRNKVDRVCLQCNGAE